MAVPSIYNPVVPCIHPIPGGFFPGKMIRVQGNTMPGAQRFAINLQCGPNTDPRDDIALHLNFRFVEMCVVRNHLTAMNWGVEDTAGGMPLRSGDSFEALILCEQHVIKVALNGQHFCEFPHRIPYQRISHVTVDGDVSIQLIGFEGAQAPPQHMYMAEPPSYGAYGAPPPSYGAPGYGAPQGYAPEKLDKSGDVTGELAKSDIRGAEIVFNNEADIVSEGFTKEITKVKQFESELLTMKQALLKRCLTDQIIMVTDRTMPFNVVFPDNPPSLSPLESEERDEPKTIASDSKFRKIDDVTIVQMPTCIKFTEADSCEVVIPKGSMLVPSSSGCGFRVVSPKQSLDHLDLSSPLKSNKDTSDSKSSINANVISKEGSASLVSMKVNVVNYSCISSERDSLKSCSERYFVCNKNDASKDSKSSPVSQKYIDGCTTVSPNMEETNSSKSSLIKDAKNVVSDGTVVPTLKNEPKHDIPKKTQAVTFDTASTEQFDGSISSENDEEEVLATATKVKNNTDIDKRMADTDQPRPVKDADQLSCQSATVDAVESKALSKKIKMTKKPSESNGTDLTKMSQHSSTNVNDSNAVAEVTSLNYTRDGKLPKHYDDYYMQVLICQQLEWDAWSKTKKVMVDESIASNTFSKRRWSVNNTKLLPRKSPEDPISILMPLQDSATQMEVLPIELIEDKNNSIDLSSNMSTQIAVSSPKSTENKNDKFENSKNEQPFSDAISREIEILPIKPIENNNNKLRNTKDKQLLRDDILSTEIVVLPHKPIENKAVKYQNTTDEQNLHCNASHISVLSLQRSRNAAYRMMHSRKMLRLLNVSKGKLKKISLGPQKLVQTLIRGWKTGFGYVPKTAELYRNQDSSTTIVIDG